MNISLQIYNIDTSNDAITQYLGHMYLQIHTVNHNIQYTPLFCAPSLQFGPVNRSSTPNWLRRIPHIYQGWLMDNCYCQEKTSLHNPNNVTVPANLQPNDPCLLSVTEHHTREDLLICTRQVIEKHVPGSHRADSLLQPTHSHSQLVKYGDLVSSN